MEREGPRNFSIELYVEGSGILGDRLEVDEAAANSVMKRTALRRDFNVAKGYVRESREFEGDEVLTISTARVHNERQVREVGEHGISTLVRQGDVWVQFIHDQEIDDRINDWGKEHFKSHQGKTWQEVYSEEFVRRMRGEVVGGISDAFWDEKRNILLSSTLNSTRRLSLIAGTSWFLYQIIELQVLMFTSRNELSYIDNLQRAGFALSGSIGGLSIFYVSSYLLEKFLDESILKGQEFWLPNPQVLSAISGSASLLLNSGKLIRLKQS